DVAAVGTDDDRAGALEGAAQGAAVDFVRGDAAAHTRLLGDDARFEVAVEDVDRAGREGRDVDAAPVRGGRQALRRLHREAEGAAGRAQEDGAAVGAGRAGRRHHLFAFDFPFGAGRLAEAAAGGRAEGREAVAGQRGRVDVATLGRHRQRVD